PGAVESQEVPGWVETQAGCGGPLGSSVEEDTARIEAPQKSSEQGTYAGAETRSEEVAATSDWGPTTREPPATVCLEPDEDTAEPAELRPHAVETHPLNDSQVEPEIAGRREAPFSSEPGPLTSRSTVEDQIAAAADSFPTIPDEPDTASGPDSPSKV